MKRLDQLTQLTAAQLATDDIVGIRDQSAGQTKYITVKDLTGSPDNGWQATGEAWTFSSFNSTLQTGVITVPTDATIKYAIGMWVRFSQVTGGTKYAKVIAVTATTMTLDFANSVTLANEAITSPVYSTVARPVGVPSETAFVHTYTNTGSGGGTGYFKNDAGVKRVWGTGNQFTSVAGANYTASFPVGFLSTTQTVNLYITNSAAVVAHIGGAYDTTQVIEYINTATTNNRFLWFVIGT